MGGGDLHRGLGVHHRDVHAGRDELFSQPLCGHHRVRGSARHFRIRVGGHPAGNVSREEAPPRTQTATGASGPLPRLEFQRPAGAPCGHRLRNGYIGEHPDSLNGELQRGSGNGFLAVLRGDLSHRHEAGIHGLLELAAFAGAMRQLPHRSRGLVVCSIQVVRHLSGLCRGLQQISPPHSDAH